LKRLAASLVVLGLAGPAAAVELSVSAAASLTDALKEIAPIYEKASGEKVALNLGASSMLARQIQEGAPADVFFSADEAKMGTLEKAGLLLPGTRRSLLSNILVVVVAADGALPISSAKDLTSPRVRALALADPRAVPAGIYAKEWLTKAGVWTELVARVVPAENVRAALAAVEAGNVEAGIVYKTDALISKKVRVAFEVPPSEGPDISYPVAALAQSRRPDAARRFLAVLESPEARAVFERYGFAVRGEH
jgi:molybdate transport system substrate-binding protein